MTAKIGELFAGYSGLGMGVAEVIDAEVAWFSEFDDGPSKVLEYRYPGVPNHGDITKIKWTPDCPECGTELRAVNRFPGTDGYYYWCPSCSGEFPVSIRPKGMPAPVEILTAGFPCQDVSAAGKRAGLVQGTRTGLWHETARAIAALRPSLVVLENVAGLLSARGDEPTAELLAAWAVRDACTNLLTANTTAHAIAVAKGDTDRARLISARRVRIMGLRKRAVARARRADALIVRAIGTVLGTLADLGFDAEWLCLPASEVGAPHRRLRIFILAWPSADPAREQGRVDDGDGAAAADDDQPRRASIRRIVRLQRDPHGRSGAEGHGSPTERPSLLPSPRTSDTNGAGQHGDGGLDLRTAVSLLGTPTARDGKDTGDLSGVPVNGLLPRQIVLLPTPAVNDMGAGKTVDDWDEWTDEMKARHGNGNGHGKSLEIEALRLMPTPRATDGEKGGPNQRGSHGDLMLPSAVQQLLPTPVTDPDSGNGHARNLGAEAKMLPTPMVGGTSPASHGQISGQYRTQMAEALERWGDYAPAIRRWEAVTRPAPDPTEPGKNGSPRLAAAFSEWMMGVPAGWITDTPGIVRNVALKMCGNGVVRQQAAAAVDELLDRVPAWVWERVAA